MELKTKTVKKETYIAPDIAVVEIEIEQNILVGGSGGEAPNMPPVIW